MKALLHNSFRVSISSCLSHLNEQNCEICIAMKTLKQRLGIDSQIAFLVQREYNGLASFTERTRRNPKSYVEN